MRQIHDLANTIDRATGTIAERGHMERHLPPNSQSRRTVHAELEAARAEHTLAVSSLLVLLRRELPSVGKPSPPLTDFAATVSNRSVPTIYVNYMGDDDTATDYGLSTDYNFEYDDPALLIAVTDSAENRRYAADMGTDPLDIFQTVAEMVTTGADHFVLEAPGMVPFTGAELDMAKQLATEANNPYPGLKFLAEQRPGQCDTQQAHW